MARFWALLSCLSSGYGVTGTHARFWTPCPKLRRRGLLLRSSTHVRRTYRREAKRTVCVGLRKTAVRNPKTFLVAQVPCRTGAYDESSRGLSAGWRIQFDDFYRAHRFGALSPTDNVIRRFSRLGLVARRESFGPAQPAARPGRTAKGLGRLSCTVRLC